LMVKSSLILLEYLPGLKSMYEEIPEGLLTITVAINYSSISTFVFDFGVVYAYLMFVLSGLIIVFTIYKTIVQIKASKAKRLRREANL